MFDNIFLQSDFLAALLAFGLVLIPAVIIHELGHLFAAKAVGINVLEFGIGFPPRAIKLFRWGETEFTLNYLPLGGFVRPLGEGLIGPLAEGDELPDDEYDDKPKNQPAKTVMTEREELRARGVRDEDMMSVNEAKPLPRIFFMVNGAVANFISAIILFIVVALIGLPTVVGARVQVVDVPEGSLFDLPAVTSGDAIEQVDGAYFANIEALFAQLQANNGTPTDLLMLDVESDENYTITVTPNIADVLGYVLIEGIVEASPAEAAQLEPGDLIQRINGELLSSSNPTYDLQQATEEFAGQAIELGIIRDGSPLTLTLTPRANPPEGEGRLGIMIRAVFGTPDDTLFVHAPDQEELIPQPFDKAVEHGFNTTAETVGLIVSIPGRIIEGTLSPEEARPVSIIGISQIGGQVIQEGIRQGTPVMVLNFVALISIFLGFTNLLPIPGLDGGRILFVLIEVMRGKPIPPNVEATVNSISMMILLGLALIVIIYDLINPFVLPT